MMDNLDYDKTIYEKYKPFKEIPVGGLFLLAKHFYKKCETNGVDGNIVNAFDIPLNKYDYVSDHEWVVQV